MKIYVALFCLKKHFICKGSNQLKPARNFLHVFHIKPILKGNFIELVTERCSVNSCKRNLHSISGFGRTFKSQTVLEIIFGPKFLLISAKIT